MMNDMDDDDDGEDARKPAARPTTSMRSPSTAESISSPQYGRTSTMDGNHLSIPPNEGIINDDDDDSSVIQSVAGEIPFLITHWLAGYTQRDGTAHDTCDAVSSCTDTTTSSLLSNEARIAAIKQIQKATSDLAVAFQTLGAFGTIPKV